MEGKEISMSEDEFNVLDELYFVQSFDELIDLSGYPAEELIPVLRSLDAKGWVRFMKDVDTDWQDENVSEVELKQSYFLATKKGLLAHNRV